MGDIRRGLAWFPIEWDFGDHRDDGRGGPVPADPMTIYACEANDEDDEDTVWFSLSDVVRSAIEDTVLDGVIGPDHVPSLVKLRDGLAALAAEIDSHLSAEPE